MTKNREIKELYYLGAIKPVPLTPQQETIKQLNKEFNGFNNNSCKCPNCQNQRY